MIVVWDMMEELVGEPIKLRTSGRSGITGKKAHNASGLAAKDSH